MTSIPARARRINAIFSFTVRFNSPMKSVMIKDTICDLLQTLLVAGLKAIGEWVLSGGGASESDEATSHEATSPAGSTLCVQIAAPLALHMLCNAVLACWCELPDQEDSTANYVCGCPRCRRSAAECSAAREKERPVWKSIIIVLISTLILPACVNLISEQTLFPLLPGVVSLMTPGGA